MVRSGTVLAGLAGIVILAPGCEDGSGTVATKPTPAGPSEGARDGAVASSTRGFIKAQLNERLVTFDRVAKADNFIVGRNLRLTAKTYEGELFEIVGVDILPNPLSTPVVLKAEGSSTLRVLYSTDAGTEWSDPGVIMRITSFDQGVMRGSFHSKQLRPNKPATPIELSGGLFELSVPTR